jgi:hypothetical protein
MTKTDNQHTRGVDQDVERPNDIVLPPPKAAQGATREVTRQAVAVMKRQGAKLVFIVDD